MRLDTRAVALQGIGFGPRLVALQGYSEVELEDVAGVGSDQRRIVGSKSQSRTLDAIDVLMAHRYAEDEILLALVAQAVTTGALDQWRTRN